jgi:hypothetical protein
MSKIMITPEKPLGLRYVGFLDRMGWRIQEMKVCDVVGVVVAIVVVVRI